MDDKDVLLIEDYIRTNEYQPDLTMDRYFFEMHSYANFAMHEILRRVVCESMKLPAHITGKESLTLTEIIEAFIDEMDYYSNLSSHYRAKEAFEIARDEAKCILLYICSFK